MVVRFKSQVLGLIMLATANLSFSCSNSNESIKNTKVHHSIILTDSTKEILGNLFGREHAYQHFSGVVSIKSGTDLFFTQSYGTAGPNFENQLDTRFDIGSLSKQFTAAAILQLVQMGRLSLQDPINPLLGEFGSAKWKNVTVHQLLTHTSGIPSVYQTEQGLEIFYPQPAPIALSALIDKFRDGKTRFKPGEEFEYSNSGYILLAAIIEKVSGFTYFDYMEREVFDRHGLKNTSFIRNEKSASPFYGYRDDLLKSAPIYHPSWMIGAGGAYSTAGDLSKWIHTISSQGFLTPELQEVYLKSHTRQGYGYGWQINKAGFIEHDGGSAGFISFLSFDPKTNSEIIVLTNRSFEDIRYFGRSATYIRELVSKSWKIMQGKTVEILPVIQKHTAMDGTYNLNGKGIEITSLSDSSIQVTATGMQPSRVILNSSLDGANPNEQKMIAIAKALEKRKYWKLAKYCDGEMTFVCYSGLMRIGMSAMRKQTGEITSMIPFAVADNHGLMRMKGEKGILELITYFDDDGMIQGIFENGFNDLDEEIPMIAYAAGDGNYWIDGIPYGEPSLDMLIDDNEIRFISLGREVVAKVEAAK
ncbi:MAG: serine hydrolase domain-containing protein [Cyclobacteriaceae bacterium]